MESFPSITELAINPRKKYVKLAKEYPTPIKGDGFIGCHYCNNYNLQLYVVASACPLPFPLPSLPTPYAYFPL